MPVPEQSCYHGHQELFLSSPPSVFNLSTGGISILIMMTPKLTNILQIQRCSTNTDCPAARVGTRVLYNIWCVYIWKYSCRGLWDILAKPRTVFRINSSGWRQVEVNGFKQAKIPMKTLLQKNYLANLFRYWKWSVGPAQWSMD